MEMPSRASHQLEYFRSPCSSITSTPGASGVVAVSAWRSASRRAFTASTSQGDPLWNPWSAGARNPSADGRLGVRQPGGGLAPLGGQEAPFQVAPEALALTPLREQVVEVGGVLLKERLLTLPPDLNVEMRERIVSLEPQAHVFTVTSQQLHCQVILACATLEIREDGVHALRYAFGQRIYDELLGNGVSEVEAQRRVSVMLGHERPSITRRYLGLN